MGPSLLSLSAPPASLPPHPLGPWMLCPSLSAADTGLWALSRHRRWLLCARWGAGMTGLQNSGRSSPCPLILELQGSPPPRPSSPKASRSFLSHVPHCVIRGLCDVCLSHPGLGCGPCAGCRPYDSSLVSVLPMPPQQLPNHKNLVIFVGKWVGGHPGRGAEGWGVSRPSWRPWGVANRWGRAAWKLL